MSVASYLLSFYNLQELSCSCAIVPSAAFIWLQYCTLCYSCFSCPHFPWQTQRVSPAFASHAARFLAVCIHDLWYFIYLFILSKSASALLQGAAHFPAMSVGCLAWPVCVVLAAPAASSAPLFVGAWSSHLQPSSQTLRFLN